MGKEFLPYEQALALKKLGFDEPCLRVGNPNGHTMWKWIEVDGEPPTVSINDVIQVPYGEEWTQIPTFSQAFRWFREKYRLIGYTTECSFRANIEYCFMIRGLSFEQSSEYKTYEEAELACLIELIEIVKNK